MAVTGPLWGKDMPLEGGWTLRLETLEDGRSSIGVALMHEAGPKVPPGPNAQPTFDAACEEGERLIRALGQWR